MLSFAMVVGIGFVLMVSLVVSAALTALGKYFSSLVPGLGVISVVLNIIFSFLVITSLFAAIFKVLPDVKNRVARCLRRRGSHGPAVYDRKICAGSLPGQKLECFCLWSGGVARSDPFVGLLLRPDSFLWSRIDRGVCQSFGFHLEPKPHAEWVRDARCARPDAKAGRPEPKAGGKRPTRADRRSELVEELKEQVHSIRRFDRSLRRGLPVSLILHSGL